MSTIPLLLQIPQTPTSPSPLHHPLSRTPTNLHHPRSNKVNNRNSFPPDHRQESRWAALLARATPAKPYGACSPAPLHGCNSNLASHQPALAPRQLSPVIHQRPPHQPPPVTHQPPITTTRPSPVKTYQPPSDIQQPRPAAQNTSSIRPLVPTASFNRALTSPTAIKLFNPSRRLNKSQSQLIMPRMKSLFRSGQGSRSAKEKKEAPRDKLPHDGSVRSLSNYEDATSPEPLIRKCHTVLALSSATGTAAQTRLVKDKKSNKLDFLRRMSPSKSAVFTSNKMTIDKSPSVMSDLRRLRKDSSMLPQVELEGEGSGCSRCASATSMSSRRFSASLAQDTVFCKLCLSDISIREMYQLQQCMCRFCKYVSTCVRTYIAGTIYRM